MSSMPQAFTLTVWQEILGFPTITVFCLSKVFIFTQRKLQVRCAQMSIQSRICEIPSWAFILHCWLMAVRKLGRQQSRPFGASNTKVLATLNSVSLRRLSFVNLGCCFFQ